MATNICDKSYVPFLLNQCELLILFEIIVNEYIL